MSHHFSILPAARRLTSLAVVAVSTFAVGLAFVGVAWGQSITIQPRDAFLTVGDEQQFEAALASGVTITWSVTDSDVGSINSEGLFTALSEGDTRVVGVTSTGATDTTEVLTVASFELLLPTGDIYLGPTSVDLPISSDRDISQHQVYGFRIQINFESGVLDFVRATSAGTATESWGDPVFDVVENQVRIAHAGTTPITGGAGPLVFLEFDVDSEAADGDHIAFWSGGVEFNEGSPLALIQSSRVTFLDDPQGVFGVTVNPETVSLVAGEVFPFGVTVDTAGDASVTWSITEGAAGGTIDAEGVYTAPKDVAVTTDFEVVATSISNPNVSGSATVQVSPANDAPFLQIRSFRNPLRTRSLQIFVTASETLNGAPTVTAGNTNVTMAPTDASQTVWVGSLNVDAGVLSVDVQASATGTTTSGSATLTLQF